MWVETMKVTWDEELRIHAGECVGNLPSVFKVVDNQFIIDQSGASEKEVRATVAKCPSGALTIEEY